MRSAKKQERKYRTVNTTAPHTLRKRLLTLILSFAFLLTCLPAALAVDLNVDAGFYFKQSRGGTCTLASAAMMLRRRAYLDGLTDWTAVTENSVRSTAWANGLSHSFTYKEMQVGYGTLPSRKQEKIQTLITLLSPQPAPCAAADRLHQWYFLLLRPGREHFFRPYPAGKFQCFDQRLFLLLVRGIRSQRGCVLAGQPAAGGYELSHQHPCRQGHGYDRYRERCTGYDADRCSGGRAG